MCVLYPSNFAKLTLFFRACTNARPLSASVIVCASLKGYFLVVSVFILLKVIVFFCTISYLFYIQVGIHFIYNFHNLKRSIKSSKVVVFICSYYFVFLYKEINICLIYNLHNIKWSIKS